MHGKGKVGEQIERALGASGGSTATWDFPELRVELKTIPLDASRGAPRESTFVCAVSLADADRAEWATSWVRAKLSRVLWVPVEVHGNGTRCIGEARLVVAVRGAGGRAPPGTSRRSSGSWARAAWKR